MKQSYVTFPDQIQLECPNREEALAIYEDCKFYFQHGVRLKPGATVIDAGAHVGVFAGMVATMCKGSATIHTFEPIPQTASMLRRNVARMAPVRVHVYECALGSMEGKLEFAYHPETPMLSSAFPEETTAEYLKLRETLIRNSSGIDTPPRLKALGVIPVFLRRVVLDRTLGCHFRFERVICPVRRLADVISEEAIANIDLLKINVEKSEELLLAGLDSCWSIVRQAVIEVHDIDGRLQRIESLLRQQRFGTVSVGQSDIMRGSEVYLVYALR
ncbi:MULTISPECIES: FkbM family methyltransferase [unclassified Microcoleus]|uniref:FkbM family methyltransferase n=1 Tax=unclassified Microcoleus TaxID=2642155 RepID=UPI002FD58811